MENWIFCFKQLHKSSCTEHFPCIAANQYFPLFRSDICSEIVPSTGPTAQMRRVVTPTVCTYPVRERTREQQLLHSFPLRTHNSTASTGCICIMTLVCSSRKKTHFLSKKHRPSARTDSLPALQAAQAQIHTGLRYLDVWIWTYLSTAAPPGTSVGRLMLFPFCILGRKTQHHGVQNKAETPQPFVVYSFHVGKRVQ